jgi:hypothetical protein
LRAHPERRAKKNTRKDPLPRIAEVRTNTHTSHEVARESVVHTGAAEEEDMSNAARGAEYAERDEVARRVGEEKVEAEKQRGRRDARAVREVREVRDEEDRWKRLSRGVERRPPESMKSTGRRGDRWERVGTHEMTDYQRRTSRVARCTDQAGNNRLSVSASRAMWVGGV